MARFLKSLTILLFLKDSNARINGKHDEVLKTFMDQSWNGILPGTKSYDSSLSITAESSRSELEKRMKEREKEENKLVSEPHKTINEIRGDFIQKASSDFDSLLGKRDSQSQQDERMTQRVDEDEYENIRIHFVNDNLADWYGLGFDDTLDHILMEVLPEVGHFFHDMLKIDPYPKTIDIPEDVCSNKIGIIPDDLIEDGVDDTDLVIFTAGIVNCGSSIAGAAPCLLSPYNFRPIVGYILFCVESPGFEEDSGISPVEAVAHEVAHLIGMDSALYPYFLNPETKRPYRSDILTNQEKETIMCPDGFEKPVLKASDKVVQMSETKTGIPFYEIVTPKVKTVVRNQFDCQSMTGARLENQETIVEECYGSHWDQRLFYTEKMGARYVSDHNALSPLTLALLEDTGWYVGNYSMTEPSIFGLGAGCDFVYEDCINDGVLPDYSKGYFCNDVSTLDFGGMHFTCTTTHSSVGICDLFDFVDDGIFLPPPPEEMYYHDSEPHSPVYFTGADYCPTSMQLHESWSCQVYPDGSIAHDGMCLNLKTSNSTGVQCANYFCNPLLKKLQVHHFAFEDGEDTVTCDFDFQLHDHPWFDDVQMECPKLSTMCPQFFSCPAMCSANGICDYSSESPVCTCFDENDISESCDGSVMRETSMDAAEEEVVVLDVVEANEEVVSEELMEEEESVEEITVEEEASAEESIEEEEEEEVSDCIPSLFIPCP